MDKKFSLKDQLFNKQNVTKIADEISYVYPAFATNDFITTVVSKFSQLELKQLITSISQSFKSYLPVDLRSTSEI